MSVFYFSRGLLRARHHANMPGNPPSWGGGLLQFMGRQFIVTVMTSDSLVRLLGFVSQALPFMGWDVNKVTSTFYASVSSTARVG